MPFTADVQQLLTKALRPVPLVSQSLSPATINLKASDAQRLFPGARDASAALAGLALQLGDWEGAHHIAQGVSSLLFSCSLRVPVAIFGP